MGHGAGDRLLRVVAERINGCVRADDLAARLGGDEFAVLLLDTPNLDRSLAVAQRIIEALQVPFQIGGQEIAVGASIGIAATSRADDTADVLLRNADVAMYTAKAAGKRRAAVFEPTMHAALVARHSLSAELSRSLGRGELAVFFQPIVRLADGQMAGVEALVRWRHPTRGLILPGEFIALAEETGLILALGRWVLAESAMRFGAWQAQPGVADDFFVSVNISPLQLQQPEFIDEIESILGATGLDPSRLVLELTETAMFQDTEATIVKLGALRARGVRIALDDFGTGYSSLGYLRRFPVDILKIARDFVVQPDLGAERVGLRPRDRGPRPDAGAAHHRRGHRGSRAGRAPAPAGLRVRPGVPPRAPARRQPAGRAPSLPSRRAPSSRSGAAGGAAAEGRVLMFILYAVPLGLIVGALLGGRLAGLATIRFRWAGLALFGFAAQVVLFSDPVTARVGDLGPPLYVASTALVFVAVLRNLAIRGMPLVAAGAASNLAAIVANGGYMPTSASAAAEFGRSAPEAYSNSAIVESPALAPLTDVIPLPQWLPFANIVSVGDILIAAGIVVVIAAAMRAGRRRAGDDEPAQPASPVPTGNASV